MKIHSVLLLQHLANVSDEGMTFTWDIPEGEVVFAERDNQGTICLVVVEHEASIPWDEPFLPLEPPIWGQQDALDKSDA